METYGILIIDDAFFLRNLIKRAIKNKPSLDYPYNFEILGEGEDADEGLKLYQLLKPEIVTIDLHLKEQSGLDLIKKIKKINQNAKIIVISSRLDAEFEKIVADLGCLSVKKPFQESYLWNRLDTIIKELKEKPVNKPVNNIEKNYEQKQNNFQRKDSVEKNYDNKQKRKVEMASFKECGTIKPVPLSSTSKKTPKKEKSNTPISTTLNLIYEEEEDSLLKEECIDKESSSLEESKEESSNEENVESSISLTDQELLNSIEYNIDEILPSTSKNEEATKTSEDENLESNVEPTAAFETIPKIDIENNFGDHAIKMELNDIIESNIEYENNPSIEIAPPVNDELKNMYSERLEKNYGVSFIRNNDHIHEQEENEKIGLLSKIINKIFKKNDKKKGELH